jgi:hypothetical protein
MHVLQKLVQKNNLFGWMDGAVRKGEKANSSQSSEDVQR